MTDSFVKGNGSVGALDGVGVGFGSREGPGDGAGDPPGATTSVPTRRQLFFSDRSRTLPPRSAQTRNAREPAGRPAGSALRTRTVFVVLGARRRTANVATSRVPALSPT